MSKKEPYFILDSEHTDPARVKREREKARELRKTQWWLTLVNRGICHYCEKKFKSNQLTMDHIVPIARGGTSTRGNIVAACKSCNQEKKLETPAERLLRELERDEHGEE